MTEAEFIAALRTLPLHPGASGLLDDVAMLASGGDTLVLSTDTMVEGIHFLPALPAVDVAWRLVACALSDLAAKGAEPVGVLLNYPLRGSPAQAGAQLLTDGAERASLAASVIAPGPRPSPGNMAGEDWDAAFLDGFGQALSHLAAPLLGGDTVSIPPGARRVLTLTAIGRATHSPVPIRAGAKAGDLLHVTGVIGAALLGFEHPGTEPNVYRRPTPRIADGIALAPYVSAMMDVSDGLLLDASRMAAASALAVEVVIDSVPMPPELAHDRIRAATWGDDYQLLFAASPGATLPVPATCIGRFARGSGLTVMDRGVPVPLPASLGYQHG